MFTRPLSPASGLSPAASRNAAFIPSISACKSRPATRAYYRAFAPPWTPLLAGPLIPTLEGTGTLTSCGPFDAGCRRVPLS
jgi:hypothetical protein